MSKESERVIIDTNLWISFLISKNYTQLDEIIFSRKSILIYSEELLDEFLTVSKDLNSEDFLAYKTLKI